jgi:hypothetical protein
MPTHEISEQNVRPLREYGSNLLFLALATVLGLAAAATGVYFITLGGLFPAMILWFVIAGPCLKFVWNDFGRIQVDRVHYRDDYDLCVQCREPDPCAYRLANIR